MIALGNSRLVAAVKLSTECAVTIKMVISAFVPSNERKNWLRIKFGSTPNAIMLTAEAFRVPDPV